MKTKFLHCVFVLILFPLLPASAGTVTDELCRIIEDYHAEGAGSDINPHLHREERDARMRAIVERYENLGIEGETALLEIFKNPDPDKIRFVESPGRVREFAVGLYLNSSIRSDGPMFEHLRSNLRQFIDSNFDKRNDVMIYPAVRALIKKGTAEDVELVRQLGKCRYNEYPEFSRWAVKAFEKRLKNERLNAKRASGGGDRSNSPEGLPASRGSRSRGTSGESSGFPGKRPAAWAGAAALAAAAVLFAVLFLKKRRAS